MVHISVIEARLSQLGVQLSRWYQPEIKELQHILTDNEKIIAAVPGRYFAGYALLVATDQRLLLIDKRTLFITLEDIRYDMISETNFSSKLFDATAHIYTLNKQHRFTAIKYKKQLRDLVSYVQRRVMEIRQGVPNEQPDLYQPETVSQAPHFPALSAIPRHLSVPHHLPKPRINSQIVGSAALKGIGGGYTPRLPHTTTTYTGPAILSGMLGSKRY